MEVILQGEERIDDLQLNGYQIIQDPSRFCFGIDAVLLSTFAKVKPKDKVMDLCTGNGVVPLLLAGKSESQVIHGVEIQEGNVNLANRSVAMNELGGRVTIYQGDVKSLDKAQIILSAGNNTQRGDDKNLEINSATNHNCGLKEESKCIVNGSYQVVTVNPPYMIGEHGLTNTDDCKTIARHEVLCTLDDIIKSGGKLLNDKGRFYMVHRPFRLAEIFATMMKYNLEPKRMRLVHPYVDKEPNMVLIEGIKNAKSRIIVEPPLIVYNNDGSYTDEILEWYGDMKN